MVLLRRPGFEVFDCGRDAVSGEVADVFLKVNVAAQQATVFVDGARFGSGCGIYQEFFSRAWTKDTFGVAVFRFCSSSVVPTWACLARSLASESETFGYRPSDRRRRSLDTRRQTSLAALGYPDPKAGKSAVIVRLLPRFQGPSGI